MRMENFKKYTIIERREAQSPDTWTQPRNIFKIWPYKQPQLHGGSIRRAFNTLNNCSQEGRKYCF